MQFIKTKGAIMSLSSEAAFLKIRGKPGCGYKHLLWADNRVVSPFRKEDQKGISGEFYKWAEKYKANHLVVFCYARHLKLAYDFFSENHENVLTEAPDSEISTDLDFAL